MNVQRLWDDLRKSGSVGRGVAGGLSRLSLGDDDKVMRDLFCGWCAEAGCSIRVDQMGNIFARRAGSGEKLPAVLIGSHLDTQIAGGRYDGVLGVLAGLELVRTLNDHSIKTSRPIEIVSWTNEEGVRFQPPMIGSGVFAGVHNAEWARGQVDENGTSIATELRRIGYGGTALADAQGYDSYFELHIEQGPILDAEGVHVGIVTGGFKSFGASVEIGGENAHTGPTPMKLRKNALVGAALVVTKLNEIGWKYEPDGRTACSRIEVRPNKYGIIPHYAEVTVDARHPDPMKARAMYQELVDELPRLAQTGNVRISIAKEWSFGDVSFDDELVNLVRGVAAELGVSHRHLVSVAGHDAYHVSRVIPTALIFTPCRDGVTHNEAEHIEPGYTQAGLNVLLHSVLRRANA